MSLSKYSGADICREFLRRLLRDATTAQLRAELDRRRRSRKNLAKQAKRAVTLATAKPLTNGIRREFLEFAADELGLHVNDLVSRDRTNRVAKPRQVAMSAMRKCLGTTLQETAEAFGRSDHGTVLWAKDAISRAPELVAQAQDLAARWEAERAAVNS